MIVKQNQSWDTGEDWGFEVYCGRPDGSPITISEARFRMWTEERIAIDWNSASNPGTVYFTGPVLTIVVPRALRSGIINDVYDYVAQVVDSNGVVSDQLGGTLRVDRSGFPEAA
jgi:hypothetical protein